MAADATAFGSREWDFACVITGIWPREKDGSELSYSVIAWIYDVANDLLPVGSGAYSADLGPDPRDVFLAAQAFGQNLSRLAHFKQVQDPCNLLAYACPLLAISRRQRLIILITGLSGVGKDHSARTWVKFLEDHNITALQVSISDAMKQEYSEVTGADMDRLQEDRVYKEQHRPALTAYFEEQVRKRPQLREEHFVNVVESARDVDVHLIIGIRDNAPVATLSHLVPSIKVVELYLSASLATRRSRRGYDDHDKHIVFDNIRNDYNMTEPDSFGLDHQPDIFFDNENNGVEDAKNLAKPIYFHFSIKN